MQKVYFDNAATTKVDPRVLEAMLPYLKDQYGNPSSLYKLGQKARLAMVEAREAMAKFLNAKPTEIIFTSCSTESINFSHKGLLEALQSRVGTLQSRTKAPQGEKNHLITTAIEHKAVIETVKHLERLGTAVTWVQVDKFGLVNLDELEKAIKENTVLVSVMYVNNEVGTIEPIEEIGQFLKKINKEREERNFPRVYFHSDATQAIQYLNCDVQKLGVDMLSLAGHKFHAPKGVGALFVRSGTPLSRVQDGGEQEENLRAGTENVAYILGLARAIELINQEKEKTKEVAKLRDCLVEGVLERIDGAYLTGHPEKRAPHIASFIVRGVEGEAMILALDEKGVAVSSGSACTSGDLKPSHVLLAMGIPPEEAHGSVRISLSKYSTREEVDYFLEVFPEIVTRLREMAPKYKY